MSILFAGSAPNLHLRLLKLLRFRFRLTLLLVDQLIGCSMTLSDLANLSTFVSGIAVASSLIYLAIQVHQNTKHARALIRQGRASRVVDVQLAQTNADVAAAVIIANGGEPTPEEVKRRQFRSLFTAQFHSHEDSFSQYQSGLMDKDGCALTRASIGRLFSQPGYHTAWQSFKTPGTKFTAFVDEILSKMPTTSMENERVG